MRPIRRLLCLSTLCAMTACGSIPTKAFEFDAIDTAEQPRPCLVVVNDDWVGAAEKNQFVNVDGDDALRLEIPFTAAEIEVTIAPVLVESGKVTRVPKTRKEARDYSGFMDDTRRLRLLDPMRQLFILARKSGSS
ncbi:MAG: hypothetical protein JNK15_21895 [Planctomycetes bacterium]|nr:hypothetical protein [Planctomycetota bacterium]